jgi:hypothetical protein
MIMIGATTGMPFATQSTAGSRALNTTVTRRATALPRTTLKAFLEGPGPGTVARAIRRAAQMLDTRDPDDGPAAGAP